MAAKHNDSSPLEISRGRRDDWRTQLLLTQRGKPQALLANCLTALRSAPEWKEVLAFDQFALTVVAQHATPWGHIGAWTDQEDRLTADWLQHQGLAVSTKTTWEAVQTVAQEHGFHPVRRYLNSLHWDRAKRVDGWLPTYLGVEFSNYSAAVGRRWLISAIARVMQPGCKADCALILEGPQGQRKSMAIEKLSSPWFTDQIADLGSKDSSLGCAGVWEIELGELVPMSRSDNERIKAFLSRMTDRFRPPYERRIIAVPRQCIFAGSTSASEYLCDESGGRRFWPVECGQIDIELLIRDRDQLWAEALALYQGRELWWLDSETLVREAEQEQSDRYDCDPWQELILPFAALRGDVSIGELLHECLDKPKGQITQHDKNRVARCLRSLGWERYNSRRGSAREWRYRPAH